MSSGFVAGAVSGGWVVYGLWLFFSAIVQCEWSWNDPQMHAATRSSNKMHNVTNSVIVARVIGGGSGSLWMMVVRCSVNYGAMVRRD